jgi:hypothetical protein
VPDVPLCAHPQRISRKRRADFLRRERATASSSFKVAECTDYTNRSVPYRYELEQMALLINVPPARRKAGFKQAAGFATNPTDADE